MRAIIITGIIVMGAVGIFSMYYEHEERKETQTSTPTLQQVGTEGSIIITHDTVYVHDTVYKTKVTHIDKANTVWIGGSK